jgi:hypothetical protein
MKLVGMAIVGHCPICRHVLTEDEPFCATDGVNVSGLTEAQVRGLATRTTRWAPAVPVAPATDLGGIGRVILGVILLFPIAVLIALWINSSGNSPDDDAYAPLAGNVEAHTQMYISGTDGSKVPAGEIMYADSDTIWVYDEGGGGEPAMLVPLSRRNLVGNGHYWVKR